MSANVNKNGGAAPGNNNPNGMKRRLNNDPRQRPNNHQQPPQPSQPPNRFNQQQQQGGRFPQGGRGRGGPPGHHHQPPGGRGFRPSDRGPNNNHNMPPMGRGVMNNGRGPPGGRGPHQMPPGRGGPMHGGRNQMHGPGRGGPMHGGRNQMHGPGGRNQQMRMGGRGSGGAPPPPPPAAMRGPSFPPNNQPMNPMNNNNNNIQVPPPPPVSHYGHGPTNQGIPPPPPPGRHPHHHQHQHQQPFPPQQHQQPNPLFGPPQHQHPMHQHPPNQFHHPHPSLPGGQPSGPIPRQLQHQQQHLQQHQRPFQNQFGGQAAVAQPPIQGNSLTQMTSSYPGAPKQVSSVSPNNASTPYTKEQVNQAWTEHTAPNGVKYYHNSLLQTSTYTKPDCLNQKDKATADAASRPWAEYTDSTTGKKYYSNGLTTTWVKPSGFTSPTEVVAKSNQEEALASQQSSPAVESPKKKRKKAEATETQFHNKEEAVAAFKGLLLAKDVSPSQKWNEVIKMCSSDARWDECEAVLSTGERKQAMAEYQTKRANELRTKERQERARAKDAFMQLLTEVLPKNEQFSVWKSRFADIRANISRDDRFYAVQDEGQRESLFLDFCEELRKHDERKKRKNRSDTRETFLSFLKEKEEAGTLSFSSTWNSFLSSLDAKDQADSRFVVSSFLTDSDRQLYFADFVIELQATEDDKRRRIRDARRRAEKAQRDAFRDALEKLASAGKITPFTHWRDVERVVESDSSFAPVQEQDREAPREIFQEYIEEWDDVYRRDRSFLSHLVHPSSNREILVTSEMKYDEFVKALLEEAKFSPQLLAETRRLAKAVEPTSSARVYFKELVDRAKQKSSVLPRRRANARRGSLQEDSSEDEGEIVEDGEVEENKQDTEPSQNSSSLPKEGKEETEEGKQEDENEHKSKPTTDESLDKATDSSHL